MHKDYYIRILYDQNVSVEKFYHSYNQQLTINFSNLPLKSPHKVTPVYTNPRLKVVRYAPYPHVQHLSLFNAYFAG
jgi:hypothetical protein